MIISIDPGVSNCGVTILEEKDKILYVIDRMNISGARKLKGVHAMMAEMYDERDGKIYRIADEINEMMDKYPDVKDIVIEAPFFNRFSPVSFAALLEVLITVKLKVAVPRNLKLTVIAPKLVKKRFTGSGNAKKIDMENTLAKKVEEGEIVFKCDIEKLTEHETDSVGVGYSFYNK